MQVEWGTDTNSLEHVAFGERNSYVSDYPDAYYVSGIFHHTKLEGLAPETTYFYRQAKCRWRHFALTAESHAPAKLASIAGVVTPAKRGAAS